MNALYFATFAMCVALCMGGQCGKEEDKRVYTFATGTHSKPYSFLNDDGELMGLTKDIVQRVCEKACKKCEFIAFTDWNLCWDPNTMQGTGLNNRYFDVCAGWVGTKQRELVYSILGTFANPRPDALFVRQESDIQEFDPNRHKIGFGQSYRADDVCLKVKKGWQVKRGSRYATLTDLYNSVRNGSIDVGFMDEEVENHFGGLRKISDSIACATKGHSLMMRKDVAPDYDWFPAVLKDVMASNYYKWICNIAKRAYGGDPHCIIADKKVDMHGQ